MVVDEPYNECLVGYTPAWLLMNRIMRVSCWMRSCMVVDEPYNACVLLDALLHGC